MNLFMKRKCGKQKKRIEDYFSSILFILQDLSVDPKFDF